MDESSNEKKGKERGKEKKRHENCNKNWNFIKHFTSIIGLYALYIGHVPKIYDC